VLPVSTEEERERRRKRRKEKKLLGSRLSAKENEEVVNGGEGPPKSMSLSHKKIFKGSFISTSSYKYVFT
jgi:hypothetical protein